MHQRLRCGTGFVITICVYLASTLSLKICMRVERSCYIRKFLVGRFLWVSSAFHTLIMIPNIGGGTVTECEKYLARALRTSTHDFFFILQFHTMKKIAEPFQHPFSSRQ